MDPYTVSISVLTRALVDPEAGADTGFFSGGSWSQRSDRQEGGVWGGTPQKKFES